MECKLLENEKIDDLQYNGLKIIQNNKYFKFGVDSVLLSDFAKKIKINSNVVDLGTGTGIIAILLAGKSKAQHITGIEIQKEVADMAQRSIKLNNLEEKIDIINEDINNLDIKEYAEKFDVVVTNPPYKKKNTGIVNNNEFELISRHEVKCTLENIVNISNKILKNYGEFYMINRPERLVDIIELLRKYKIEPKEIRFVISKIGQAPNLVLIKAIKDAKQFLKISNDLIIYNEDGTYTDEILKIYNKK